MPGAHTYAATARAGHSLLELSLVIAFIGIAASATAVKSASYLDRVRSEQITSAVGNFLRQSRQIAVLKGFDIDISIDGLSLVATQRDREVSTASQRRLPLDLHFQITDIIHDVSEADPLIYRSDGRSSRTATAKLLMRGRSFDIDLGNP